MSASSPEQVTAQAPAPPGPLADGSATAGPGRRHGGRGWLVAGVVVVLIAAGLIAASAAGAFKGNGSASSGLAGGSYQTGTAVVTRQSLVSQSQVSATLGDTGSYTVVNQAAGTITALPHTGKVIGQGHVLYQVSGDPVVLLYGHVPAYRTLSVGLTGADVTELNTDLVALGYLTRAELGPTSGWDTYTAATAYGVEQLQTHLGLTEVTGSLTLGQAVFLPGPALITGLTTGVVLGGSAQPGSAILTASSTTPVATISLNPDERGEVHPGERVGITLPSGKVTPGVVASVGNVASGTGSSASIPVKVRLLHPNAAAHLDQAQVEVVITTSRARNALTVPVDALLAQPGGSYDVEVVGSGGAHHLVPVTLGLFDDAAGRVQVTGGLTPGERVVVPSV